MRRLKLPISHSCPTCGAALLETSPGGLCPGCLLSAALEEIASPELDDSAGAQLAAGSTLGPFRIIGLLGKGGMAAVYEAYDSSLERSVALKVLPPEFLHDDSFARRFRQEGTRIPNFILSPASAACFHMHCILG